jgi:hypothetical protein
MFVLKTFFLFLTIFLISCENILIYSPGYNPMLDPIFEIKHLSDTMDQFLHNEPKSPCEEIIKDSSKLDKNKHKLEYYDCGDEYYLKNDFSYDHCRKLVLDMKDKFNRINVFHLVKEDGISTAGLKFVTNIKDGRLFCVGKNYPEEVSNEYFKVIEREANLLKNQ